MKGGSLERLHEPRASESAQATLEMALCTVALLGMFIVAGAIDAALF